MSPHDYTDSVREWGVETPPNVITLIVSVNGVLTHPT